LEIEKEEEEEEEEEELATLHVLGRVRNATEPAGPFGPRRARLTPELLGTEFLEMSGLIMVRLGGQGSILDPLDSGIHLVKV